MKGKLRDLTAAGNLMEEAIRNPGLSTAARRAGEAAVGPRPDPLSPEERAEVERRLAEGRVERCPPKAHAIDPAKAQTVKEHRARLKRIGSRQAKAARAKQRREEAAKAARGGKDAGQSRDPATDRCACGGWKRVKSPTCQSCASRARRKPDADKTREHGRLGGGAMRGPRPPEKPVTPRTDIDEILDDAFAKLGLPRITGPSPKALALRQTLTPKSEPAPEQPKAPALKAKRHGMLWWLCAPDGTRVSRPYGSRKVAEAALMEAPDAP